jgi:hypothetical protein
VGEGETREAQAEFPRSLSGNSVMLNGIRLISNAQKIKVDSPATGDGVVALRLLEWSTVAVCSVSHACNADIVDEITSAEILITYCY